MNSWSVTAILYELMTLSRLHQATQQSHSSLVDHLAMRLSEHYNLDKRHELKGMYTGRRVHALSSIQVEGVATG